MRSHENTHLSPVHVVTQVLQRDKSLAVAVQVLSGEFAEVQPLPALQATVYERLTELTLKCVN